MVKVLDLTGDRYGYWTVIVESNQIMASRRWICKCDCGTVKEVSQGSLRSLSSMSCSSHCSARIANPEVGIKARKDMYEERKRKYDLLNGV